MITAGFFVAAAVYLLRRLGRRHRRGAVGVVVIDPAGPLRSRAPRGRVDGRL